MAVTDILVSPAKIWYSPLATALPDETSVAAGASWGAGWIDLIAARGQEQIQPPARALKQDRLDYLVKGATGGRCGLLSGARLLRHFDRPRLQPRRAQRSDHAG